ncbi:MAG: iron dependent repressor, metal binding and dimerization domain protein [Anaerolineales bacterium]|jgi:DtxR family Mn-dependent transcriptional regulator
MPDPLISLIFAAIIIAVGYFIFQPERGLFWRWRRLNQRSHRVLREDALKYIYHAESQGGKPTIESLADRLSISTQQAAEIYNSLQSMDLLHLAGRTLTLTSDGRDYALRIIRAHRLYERYLADETGYDEAEWHQLAHEAEHRLTPEEIEQLASQISNPTHDPHGDPIPMSDGTIVYPQDRTILTQFPINSLGRIVHMEDEPAAIYAQLVAEGLHVGQEIEVVESSDQRIRFWTEEGEVVLAPLLAANIHVVPLKEKSAAEETAGQPLTDFKPGDQVEVLAISPRIRGVERRRLMDLGLLPGTIISVELKSAGGNPVAYRIRGAVMALRNSQAELIRVRPFDEVAAKPSHMLAQPVED